MPPVGGWKSGVYSITNVKTGKKYVGSASRSILKRLTDHRLHLDRGDHINRYLQNAWNKYGRTSFRFSILERCSPESCVGNEQKWIDHLRSADRKTGYNICPVAGRTLGIKFSEESRNKIRAKAVGRVWSQAAKEKLATTQRGHPVSDKARRALDWTGRKHSEEARKKMAERARNRSPETLAKMSESGRKKKLTEEHRQKISLGLKGRVIPRDVVERVRLANLGKKRTGRALENIRAAGFRRKKVGGV